MKEKKFYQDAFCKANKSLETIYKQIIESLASYIREHHECNNGLFIIPADDRPHVITTVPGNACDSDSYADCLCLALKEVDGTIYMFCAPSEENLDFNTEDFWSEDVVMQQHWYCLDWDEYNVFQYNIERIAYFMEHWLEDADAEPEAAQSDDAEVRTSSSDKDLDKALRENLKERFKLLVEKYGENGELWVFDCCADMGAELEDSTIDSISVSGSGDVRFYFEQKDGDYISIDRTDASAQDLQIFYEQLCVWFAAHADQ